jgi:hypothetical protein
MVTLTAGSGILSLAAATNAFSGKGHSTLDIDTFSLAWKNGGTL